MISMNVEVKLSPFVIVSRNLNCLGNATVLNEFMRDVFSTMSSLKNTAELSYLKVCKDSFERAQLSVV